MAIEVGALVVGGVEGGSELRDSDGWLRAKGKGDWRWLWRNVKLNRKGWITIGYGQGEGVEEDNQGNDLKPIDRLTEMPDDILSCILSFLSIRDSVKARILSRRWRYICPFMLNLDFDLHTVLGINYKARYSNGDSDISWEDKSKFVSGVDQFLELYNGQKLDSLRICFCLGNEYAGYVDRWIRFSIIMKTEKLDLEFSASPESQSNNLYDFPCQLLPQVKNFSFLDIPRLEKVHIRFMVAYERGTQYMFNGIANDLPRLQTLSLVLTTDEVLPIPARITRFNSLKQLELFVMVSSDFNLLSLTSLLNASPLLQKLHFGCGLVIVEAEVEWWWWGGSGGVGVEGRVVVVAAMEVVVVVVWLHCGIRDADLVIGKPWGGGGVRISQRRLWELGIAMVAVIETYICANLSIHKLNLTLDMAILGILLLSIARMSFALLEHGDLSSRASPPIQ
ncbi:hypothetical protein TEA_000293 [Camellia sinensis var. sinensis]|uniref:F-box domain-containing protein n=1 Tax=Camellia sinensis var. sinensis TaxID=542762 RepID=A0A4S4EYG5_CAMSN|nr:hypothetical protein TEA_000293 [Camellia sinensis var. sinensis]